MEDRYITEDWFTTFPHGNEMPGVKQWLDKTEQSFGEHNDTDVMYIINDYGYRGELEPEQQAPAAFGCSYTLGQGSPVHWPELVGAVNCGMNGASNDRIARAAIAYCHNYHPDTIYVMWTFGERREIVAEDGTLIRFRMPPRNRISEILSHPTAEGAHLILMNDKADEYNLEKNKLLLSSYCTANGIKLKQAQVDTISKYNYRLGRDNDHPGPEWHDAIATHFLL